MSTCHLLTSGNVKPEIARCSIEITRFRKRSDTKKNISSDDNFYTEKLTIPNKNNQSKRNYYLVHHYNRTSDFKLHMVFKWIKLSKTFKER